MGKHVIVGAGLSGMVAAINLARRGSSVIIRERREAVGGKTSIKGLEKELIIGDGTPADLERLRAYTGIDLSGVAVPLKGARNHIYGRTFDIEFPRSAPVYLFERGPRPTSLDTYLYNSAKSAGVEFRFNDTVEDFSELPPHTIIATGMFDDAFKSLNVPHVPAYAYVATAKTDDPTARVVTYFDEYPFTYAFYTQVNGAGTAVMFASGRPLDTAVKEWFEGQLSANEGLALGPWDIVSGAFPLKEASNPRLFAGNLILAGTVSGSIDPLFLFGVHGALISGKIAAMAVADHQKALEEFNRINKHFRLGFRISSSHGRTPASFHRRVAWTAARMYPYLSSALGNKMFNMIPGYGRI